MILDLADLGLDFLATTAGALGEKTGAFVHDFPKNILDMGAGIGLVVLSPAAAGALCAGLLADVPETMVGRIAVITASVVAAEVIMLFVAEVGAIIVALQVSTLTTKIAERLKEKRIARQFA